MRMKMEKIRKPTKNIFRLLFLLLGLTTLILSPLCLYSYLHYFRASPHESHSEGASDSLDLNGHGASPGQYSGARSEEEENGLLERIISKHNVAKLRRELIYIYKLPPVTDHDYEREELHLRGASRKHYGEERLGGVWFFDDLDTDDYLTDDKSIKSKVPHRFSHTLRTSHNNNSARANNPNSNGQINQSHHSRFNITQNPPPQNVNDSPKVPSMRNESTAPFPSTPSDEPLPPSQRGNETRARFFNTGHFRKSHAIIWDPHPQYIFHSFGHRFHLMLNLIPERHSFLTPNFAITTHSSGKEFANESFVRRENLKGKISGCFYNGFILGDPQSSVAVSLCHGMTGHIRTQHGSYFIEPLAPTSPEYKEKKRNHTGKRGHENDEQEILHEIYQVGLDLPNNEEEPAAEDYSYESLDNLQIGAATYEDEDEEDNYWLNPGKVTRKPKKAQPKAKTRVKRSESKERYVELSVVTDSSMSTYHGDNLRHYVLTLLSIVGLIYKDASIGNPINIALVSFHVLPDQSFAANKWTPENITSNEAHLPGISASEMLRSFCKWQKEHNNPDDKSSEHHDTALLLTRETICRNPWLHKCDTLGLAELGTMCDNYASCAIVQDNGLSAAFTIAHELGHLMNMPHDDDYKCQSFLDAQSNHPSSNNHLHQQFTFTSDTPNAAKEPQHYVMSRMLDHNTYPWAWSRCSRHFLTEFLDADHGACLEDKPGSNLLIGDPDYPDTNATSSLFNDLMSPQQPGEIFSEHKQCELVFGQSSKLCSYMPSCKRLWCTTGATTEEEEGCRTQHMPWADGTPCGTPPTSNWCQRGACVKKDLEKLRTVNGGWGSWMDFGECSRTCGGGIRKSYRECDNPRPSNGGKYCIGPRVQYESCNTFECPNENEDYRAEQCSNFNNDNFNIQGLPKDITWVPKTLGLSPKDRCKLFCRVQGSSSYYLLREKVIDGTHCTPDTFDLCVNGVCLPAGCDRRLHSKKTLDICGVCGSDGSTCRTARGSFNDTKYGYNSIIRIPAGASNIDIRQNSFDDTARDDNYLALLDSNDEYILNGHFVVSMFRKTLHYGGSILEYSGSDEVIERINSSSRPIKTDLVLQVLSVGKLNPADIIYQYVISLNYNAEERGRMSSNYAEARWTHSDRWTTCSEICQGSQTQIQVCTNSRTMSEVSSEYCRPHGKLQDVQRQCNAHCTLKWHKTQKQCDCAHPNRTEVSVKCVRETPENKTFISDGYCSKLAKPEASSDCSEECSRAKWRSTQWSECSARCGDGVQIRNVYCQKYNTHHGSRISGEQENNHYIPLADSECVGESAKPSARRKCNSGACGQWRIDDWTPCSETCGHGRQQAALYCYLEGTTLPYDFCNQHPKPQTERACEAERPCVEWTVMISDDDFVTEFEEDEHWSECSSRCSPYDGHMSRSVVCAIKQGNRRQSTKLKQISESLCTKFLSTSKPRSSKPCDLRVPDDCYNSRQSLSRFYETAAQRAHTQSSLDTSNSIDGAMSLPLVGDNSIIDDNVHHSEWITGPWSACFKSGVNAIQIREVNCPKDLCREPRPTNSRTCGVWFTGEWGNCNSTCENRMGFESREVKCVQSDGQSSYSAELEESDCLHPRPDSERACTSYCKPTGRWRTGPWGKCSRPCGVDSNTTRGQRMRQVACVDESKSSSMLPEAECDSRSKPEAISSCSDTENQPCPVWSSSDWSECMATTTTAATTTAHTKFQTKKLNKPIKMKDDLCSNSVTQDVWGHRERTVKCHDHNGHEIPEYHCALLNNKPPSHSEACMLSRKHCSQHPHYRWKVGNWSSCSKNCGSKGLKTRPVECTRVGVVGKMNTTSVIEDKYCQRGDKKRKPKVERGCARFHCPFKWVATDWTECSRTCGYGIQKRQVSCHKVNRLGWVDPDPVNGCENMEKPKEYNYCMISETCDNSTRSYGWKTEEWSECPSPTQLCGNKDNQKVLQKRRVYCTMNNQRTPQRHCEKLAPKPIRKRRCPKTICGWKSCLDVKQAGNYYDGEYQIIVGGLNMSIYCYGLTTENPREYLTIHEESVSEIYEKRLIRPETCPRNGRRLDTCECVKDTNRRSGLTNWNKIRLNVTNIKVDTDDFTFAKSSGDLIPFGTSGDCYSSAMNCPQGRFSIDLRRTRLAVNSMSTWVSQGHKPTMQITKASDNQKVDGKCGGYCGTCSPRITGLKLEIVH